MMVRAWIGVIRAIKRSSLAPRLRLSPGHCRSHGWDKPPLVRAGAPSVSSDTYRNRPKARKCTGVAEHTLLSTGNAVRDWVDKPDRDAIDLE